MIKSMTGYGRAEETVEGCTITVELRSVNNRYLDCNVRIPRLYLFAEEAIKSRVQGTISRGKVDVFVTLDHTGAEKVQVSVNRAAADGYYTALKELAGIPKDLHLIAPAVLDPIQHLKVGHLGNRNPRLHTDETLIALSISAATNPTAELAMEQLDKLRGCEVHSTVLLSGVDVNMFRRLGINLTCEPKYE